MNRKIINLVNFVRGVEPREPEKDLFLPVAEELKVNRKYGLKSTVLLQYDALLRDDIVSLFSEKDPDVELGLWFEMNRPLTEAVGIPWRVRPGYDWDWYVNPGFLPAYTPRQREQLIDEAFLKFENIFGFVPKVAGSWLLDAHSIKYMSEKYGLTAMCICREQYAVDAYTLWGGYYTGGYYPSSKNALCPSQSAETKIDTPVFRMLGIDPIYGYDEAKYPTGVWGCNTMEPVWTSGSDRRIMEWYFDVYFGSPCLSYSYATTGQENSFGWGAIKKGYELQAELIAELSSSGKISVETLGETGTSFRQSFENTPCVSLTALNDRTENGLKAVWYNSPYYRTGIVAEPGGRVYIRDLTLFDDRYEERYLNEKCESWDARYDNLPALDNRLWSKNGAESCINVSLRADPESVKVTETGDNTLLFSYKEKDGGRECSVIMSMSGIEFRTSGDIVYDPGVPEEDVSIVYSDSEKRFSYSKSGFAYSLYTDAKTVKKAASGYVLSGEPDGSDGLFHQSLGVLRSK